MKPYLLTNVFRQLVAYIQRSVEITPDSDEISLPADLRSFFLFFLRQARQPLFAILVLGTVTAVIDALIPAVIAFFIKSSLQDSTYSLGLVAPIVVLFTLIHPTVSTMQRILTNHAISANLPTLVRWQSHAHIARQPLSFFHSDLSGRLASRVLQTGPALRDTVVTAITSVWYILIFGSSAILLLGRADIFLAAPALIWSIIYIFLLRHFLPRLREHSREMSTMRSLVTARLIDTYANIQTIKLYSEAGAENSFVKDGLRGHNETYQRLLAQNSIFSGCLAFLNGALIGTTLVLAIWLAKKGSVDPSQFALVIPLVWHIAVASVSVTQQMSSIFENIGIVQEGIRSIAQPLPEQKASPLETIDRSNLHITFNDVSFSYPSSGASLQSVSFSLPPGKRLAIVGPSGAGKSTIIQLLLRLYTPDTGNILIGDRPVSEIALGSLRSTIAVVSQDTSILSRSILDNIRFGRREASPEEVAEAACLAGASSFIAELCDDKGRRGYEAHVGERGVKLSGGQKQRLALARALLKNAPILILDEATSGLDVLTEAGLRARLEQHFLGKSVVAIAHRLETIAAYDEILVLDAGRVTERGRHTDLLARRGTYWAMWNEQSSPQNEATTMATGTNTRHDQIN